MELIENQKAIDAIYFSKYMPNSSELNSIKKALKELSFVDDIDTLLVYLLNEAEVSTEDNFYHLSREDFAMVEVEGDAGLGPRTWNAFLKFWTNNVAGNNIDGRPFVDGSMVWYWDSNRSDEENLDAAKEWFKELESMEEYADKFSRRHEICYQIYDQVNAWRKKVNIYGKIYSNDNVLLGEY